MSKLFQATLPSEGEVLFNDRQTAEILKIARSTVWLYVSKGILSPVRFGARSTRFKGSQLRALIEGGTV